MRVNGEQGSSIVLVLVPGGFSVLSVRDNSPGRFESLPTKLFSFFGSVVHSSATRTVGFITCHTRVEGVLAGMEARRLVWLLFTLSELDLFRRKASVEQGIENHVKYINCCARA